MIKKLIELGESRMTSAEKKILIDFQEKNKQSSIDRTETSFAGQSRMTPKQLEDAVKAQREIDDLY